MLAARTVPFILSMSPPMKSSQVSKADSWEKRLVDACREDLKFRFKKTEE